MFTVFAAEGQARKYYAGGNPSYPGSWSWHPERAAMLTREASVTLVRALWGADIKAGRNAVAAK